MAAQGRQLSKGSQRGGCITCLDLGVDPCVDFILNPTRQRHAKVDRLWELAYRRVSIDGQLRHAGPGDHCIEVDECAARGAVDGYGSGAHVYFPLSFRKTWLFRMNGMLIFLTNAS